MSLVNGAVESVLGGVSQQPPLLRDPSQCTELINGWAAPAHGLIKRPPTQHIAQLEVSNAGFSGAFDHPVHRTSATTDHVIVKNGGISVYDSATGTKKTVTAADTAYLATTTPSKSIRAVTVGDTTFICNREKTVARLDTRTPTLGSQALVFVRSVDFATNYIVTLGVQAGDFIPNPFTQLNATQAGFIQPQTVAFLTPAGSTPQDRAAIGTDYIAQQLFNKLNANTILTAKYTFQLMNSTIFVIRNDGNPFYMQVGDGLGDTALGGIKNNTANFSDLPLSAPQGYMVQVTGSADSEFDNYWVAYDTTHLVDGKGVWRETVAPGVFTSFDPATMPHQIVRNPPKQITIQKQAFPVDHVNLTPQYDSYPGFVDSSWNNGAAIDPKSPTIISADAATAFCFLPSGANKDAKVWVWFKYDVRKLAATNSLKVSFQFETGIGTGVFTTLDTRIYTLKDGAGEDAFSTEGITVLSGVNQKLRLLLNYTTAPAGALGTITINPQTTAGKPGCNYFRKIGTIVSFDSGIRYPYGKQFSIGFPVGQSFNIGALSPVETSDTFAASFLLAFQTLQAPVTVAVIPIGPLSFALQWPSLATAGIPTITLDKTITTNSDHTVYDSSQVLDPTNRTYIGSTAIGFKADGSASGYSGSVVAMNTCSVKLSGSPFTNSEAYFVLAGIESYSFGQAAWKSRAVGDDITNPFPSFVGRNIQDVFFHRGRVGMCADDRILLTSTADLFNFWRQTALQVLDNDAIDIQNATQKPAFFHSAVPWDGHMLFFSDIQVYELTGEPLLTPSSVRLTPVMDVDSSRFVRPFAAGRRVFIPRTRAANASISQVVELSRNPVADGSGLVDTTRDLPSYMVGAPLVAAGDDVSGLFFLLTDQGNLYVHSYKYDGPDKELNSWSTWTLPSGTILGMDMTAGVLTLVMSRSDGIFLENIDLNSSPTFATTHKDRQGWGGGTIQYTFAWTLSTIFPRRRGLDYQPHHDITGKLQLRFLMLTYVGTSNFTVTVSQQDRPNRVTTFSAASAQTGFKRIGLLGKNTDIGIVISDSTTGPCGFQGYAWEATYHNRSQRLV